MGAWVAWFMNSYCTSSLDADGNAEATLGKGSHGQADGTACIISRGESGGWVMK